VYEILKTTDGHDIYYEVFCELDRCYEVVYEQTSTICVGNSSSVSSVR